MKKRLLLLLSPMLYNIYALDVQTFINNTNCDQIIVKSVYKICYNYKLKGAKFVAYTLDGNKVDSSLHIKKRPQFYVENQIPVKYRSYPTDYTHSGYDRGHLANHADFDYSASAVYQTYSMANIIPQDPKVNRDTWVKAEKYERAVAKSIRTISVINGVDYTQTPKRIGKHQIAVPESFWKIIYNNDKKFMRCFKYTNSQPTDTTKDTLKSHQIDCNSLYSI